jgi:hypothetical protein
MKNDIFWAVTPCGIKTHISEEHIITSIIRLTRIGELGTTLAVTSNRSTFQSISSQCASVASYLLTPVTLMMEAIYPSETSVLTEPQGIISQNMAFFLFRCFLYWCYSTWDDIT